MAHIDRVKIDNTTHLIEPTLYTEATSLSNGVYAASLNNFELIEGVEISLKLNNTSPTGTKLNISNSGDINLKYNGAPITTGMLEANKIYNFVYTSSAWELISNMDTNLTKDGILYATSSYTYSTLPVGPAGQVLIGTNSCPVWYPGLILSETTTSSYQATFQKDVDIYGNTTISGTLSVGANTTLGSNLNVTGTTSLSGHVGIGTSPSQDYTVSIVGTSSSQDYAVSIVGNSLFKGNLIPQATSSYTLGNEDARWKKLYIGTTNTYGDMYTPIYWNNGEPAQVAVVQQYDFTFSGGGTSYSVSTSNANASKAVVTQIVADVGLSYLNGPISWATTSNSITLTTAATSSVVSGYFLVSTGS